VTVPTLGKDLLGLESLTKEQIQLILDTAEPFKEVSERTIKKVPALRGKTIVNLFFESSKLPPEPASPSNLPRSDSPLTQ
jgi:aspartate carbamoyltransferase catalytic subunit